MTHHIALIGAAKRLAIECIGSGETLQPFVITEGGRGSVITIVGESTAELLLIAQRAIDDLPPDARVWAFAYDGYLTLDQEKTDAIFIEVADRSAPNVTVYAQRYAAASPDAEMKLIGTLAQVSKIPARLQNQRFFNSRMEGNQTSKPQPGVAPGRDSPSRTVRK